MWLQKHADGEEEAEEEDVACGGGEEAVEVATVEGVELSEGAEVEDEVDYHEGVADGGVGKEEEGEEGEDGGEDAYPKVVVADDLLCFACACLIAEEADLLVHCADYDGAFAAQFVLMAVAVVVDHQQVVGGEAYGETCDDEGDVPASVGHDVVGEYDGDETEEDEDEEVAPAEVGEACGVEEAEEDAQDADEDEF